MVGIILCVYIYFTFKRYKPVYVQQWGFDQSIIFIENAILKFN